MDLDPGNVDPTAILAGLCAEEFSVQGNQCALTGDPMAGIAVVFLMAALGGGMDGGGGGIDGGGGGAPSQDNPCPSE